MFEFLIPLLVVFVLLALLEKIEVFDFKRHKCDEDEIESLKEEIKAIKEQLSNIKQECYKEIKHEH